MKSRWHRISFGSFAVMVPLVLAVGTAACSDDGADGAGADDAAAEEGKQIAARSGCAGCHGANGEGGVGPPWVGLVGSQVQLTDGTTVVADDAYLISAIKTPDAQKVAGFAVAMPVNQLNDEDIAKVIAYITSLTDATVTTPPPGPTAPTIPVATAAPG